MKASETRLRSILEGQQHYVIPLFQRPYSWGRKDWNTLWSDVIETYISNSSEGHFLGSIVSKPQPGTPEGVSPYIVIDGQQRLTTLSILLAALRDRISEVNPEGGERIDDLCLKNKYAKEEYRYKIRPTQADRSAYFALIDGSDNSTDEEESSICQAYDFFFDALSRSADEEDNEPIDLTRLERLLLDEVEVVSITLEDNDNEYRIFESLNWKGAPLSQADLLRNYFFMRIHDDQQQALYDSVWSPMQAMLNSTELTDFFRYQYMSTGRSVRLNDIYLKWRNDLDRLDPHGLADEMRKLAGFSQYYKRIIEPETEPDADVRERLIRLNRWGSQTMYPLILRVYEVSGGRNIASLIIIKSVLCLIESYLVRRMFCGIPTQGLNKFFRELSARPLDEDIVETVQQVLSQPTGSRRWPTNSEFREGLLNYGLYEGSKPEQRRLVLESLEQTHKHKEPVELRGLTVEHVMPQKLTAVWRDTLGPDADAIHTNLLHTIGNLTLTGYNPEMSNLSFREKRLRFQDSNLGMNREIAEEGEWGPEQIRSRAERLAARAIKIWPGPVERTP